MSENDTYVALLRGVNVGGRNPVPKAALRAELEALGFDDVLVHLNSGNAVFSARTKPDSESLRAALEKRFGFAIPSLVIPGSQMRTISAALPAEWTYDKPNPEKQGHFAHVMYLFPEVDSPDFAEQIGYDSATETCIYTPGALLHRVSQENWTHSCLSRITGRKAYASVTVRNVNTARRLAELTVATESSDSPS